ncbi:MAG TPA: hydrogenase maturation nickel metallochaperone HypA, partial [Bryobacteraceae bacterium]|nr:hydrogenase maturation nickel metallochaperone HypA [Bryobacteraceae bacterium]
SQARGGVRILTVHLKLGALSGVVKKALLGSFEMAAEGTALEGSQLVIEDVPVTIFCPTCRQRRVLPSLQLFQCPECSRPATDVIEGTELQVTALELAA